MDLDKVHSNGYAFQIEMAYRVSTAGHRVGEIPIIFYERESGSSKMSKGIIREAMVLPWRLRLGRLMGGTGKDPGYNFRTVVGFLFMISGAAGCLWLAWWLGTKGDIIEIIHRAKMSLPGWAWTAMKVGLSTGSAVVFIALILTAGIAVFAAGGRK
jgi:hypothetical protein